MHEQANAGQTHHKRSTPCHIQSFCCDQDLQDQSENFQKKSLTFNGSFHDFVACEQSRVVTKVPRYLPRYDMYLPDYIIVYSTLEYI